jgi:hypothetical protein
MMKAGERELLRFGFHRLALTFPTLNEATLSSVQVQHIGDGHFLALCRAVAGGVVPGRYGCEYLARPTAGLIGGEHTIPPDSHEATLGVAYDPITLELGPFYWLGKAPGLPLGDLGERVARHTRRNLAGRRAERPDLRTITRRRFRTLETIEDVVGVLFGER